MRGGVECLWWEGKPLKYSAKEFKSHRSLLQPNITFEFLFQFREGAWGPPCSGEAACTAQGPPLELYLVLLCRGRRAVLLGSRGREGAEGGRRASAPPWGLFLSSRGLLFSQPALWGGLSAAQRSEPCASHSLLRPPPRHSHGKIPKCQKSWGFLVCFLKPLT